MRLYAIAGLLILTGLSLGVPSAHGCCGTPATGTPVPVACALPVPQITVPAAARSVVAEMVAILDKTESKDTFLMTVMTLRSMGPESREALPAILRNGERLGLLRGIADDLGRKEKTTKAEVSAATQEIRGALLDIAAGARDHKPQNPMPLPPSPLPPPVQPLSPYIPQPGQTPAVPQVTPTTLSPTP